MNNQSSGPVFIVGMNGSGTTLMLDLLNHHPDLYGFRRETKLLPYFISNLNKYGDLENDNNFHSLWKDVASMEQLRLANDGVPPPMPEQWRQMPRNLASVIDSIFKYFASKENKRIWCEKTPMHVLYIRELSNLFPTARFLHIIRDGRDCAASMHRRWHDQPELTIYRWKQAIAKGQSDGQTIGSRYLEVRYEHLIAEPESCMRTVSHFLNIPFDDRLLKTSRQRGSSIQGRGSKKLSKTEITGLSRTWKDYFSSKQLRRLESIAGFRLHNLGYTTNYPESDYNPARYRILFWKSADYIKKGFWLLWDGFFKKDPTVGWGTRWAVVTTAIKRFGREL